MPNELIIANANGCDGHESGLQGCSKEIIKSPRNHRRLFSLLSLYSMGCSEVRRKVQKE